MKKLSLMLACLLLAGSLLAPVAQAQSPPSPGPAVKQRAPGVPIAPQPGEVSRLRSEERGLFHQYGRAAQEANRDLPMPRGVPSIIAP